ncbi:MAG: hypothetical protein ABGY32_00250 [bacterium]
MQQMPSTAKRRWSRELATIVDGIGISSQGPILVHGYDAPPGGKWPDDVIPGKLGAMDRATGEQCWMVPCEVGYGRGFAVGFGARSQVLVLGPTAHGHRVVRMSVESGEILDVATIPVFDQASFGSECVYCCSARRIFSLDTNSLEEAWSYSREGERYHQCMPLDGRVLVVFSTRAGGQGLLAIDSKSGNFLEVMIPPLLPVIHGLVATGAVAVLLTESLDKVLEGEAASDLMRSVALHPSGGIRDTLSLIAMSVTGSSLSAPEWIEVLETKDHDEFPEASISADSGKLYLERGNQLNALDALTGRPLGVWTVPGLDERVDWSVADGAGLLAEEGRLSVFEFLA